MAKHIGMMHKPGKLKEFKMGGLKQMTFGTGQIKGFGIKKPTKLHKPKF